MFPYRDDKGTFDMETFTANKISEMLERDRATVLRALNNTPPDAEVRGKPQWKISTASAAMSTHLQRGGSGNGRTQYAAGNVDPRLQREYDTYEQADAAMRQLKTVEARRKAAIAMGPQIARMDELQRRISIAGNHNDELVELKADRLFMLYLRGIEGPCAWSASEVWSKIDCRG